MYKIVLYLAIMLTIGTFSIAQDNVVNALQRQQNRNFKKDNDTSTNWNWKHGGMMSFNLAQGSLSNWAAGR